MEQIKKFRLWLYAPAHEGRRSKPRAKQPCGNASPAAAPGTAASLDELGAAVEQVKAWFRGQNLIPCTACVKCGRCEAACPQHLPIRELLVKAAEEFERQGYSG